MWGTMRFVPETATLALRAVTLVVRALRSCGVHPLLGSLGRPATCGVAERSRNDSPELATVQPTRCRNEPPEPAPDGAGRAMTDGGHDEDDHLFQRADPPGEDADPFDWGPDVEPPAESPTENGSGTTPSSQAGRPPRGGLPAPTGGREQDTDIVNRIRTMERRLERVSDIASDIDVAMLNGDIKLYRREPDELEAIHEKIKAQAGHLDREVDRLAEQLEALEAAVEARPRRRPLEGHAGTMTGGTRGSVVPEGRQSSMSPSGTPSISTNQGPDVEFDDGPAEPSRAPSIAPTVDDLLPGTKLRDMWRIARRTATNGDGGLTERSYERWIVETRPGASESVADGDEGSPEFPPEVTEFTLDDDEIPFEVLLELVADDEPF